MINRFLDTDGCVTVWPKKQSDKVLVLDYLATKFDANKTYTELEVNEILKLWHTFSDWPLLRRELVDRGYMQRDRSGYEYKLSCLVINIARHGQTDDNLAGIISYPQAKLTDKGVQQAIELARDVKEKGQDFDYIICSPIARAVATAEIIAQQLGGKKIYQDKRLVEGDFKKWEGRSIEELDRYFGSDKLDWNAYLDLDFGGEIESYVDTSMRLRSFLFERRDELCNNRVLLISHNQTIKCLQKMAYGFCDNENINNSQLYTMVVRERVFR